jgi:regulator of protease activity HflC (stomatin/prohibitin superfamily)
MPGKRHGNAETRCHQTGMDGGAIPSLRTEIEVPSGFSSLLYFDGAFQRVLKSGTYFFWNGSVKVESQLVDMRVQQIDIAGQEIITADKVSLRINFVCNYKVNDAVKIMTEIKDYKTGIYVLTQLILREYIGKYRFDELLEQKENIASFVLEKLREKHDDYYVEFLDSGLKDIILPGEIREIMNTVLVAEKKAQANVITRREEVASTRSLLNTAKLMEENKTLYKLKELEYLEKICDKVGNISVGDGNLLNRLGEILSAKQE